MLLVWFISVVISGVIYSIILPLSQNDVDYIAIDGNFQLNAYFSDQSMDGESWDTAYVFKNLDFDIPDNKYGLILKNTDKHIIIKDCEFKAVGYRDSYGIYIFNCENIKIDSINLIYCDIGTNIINSTNIEVSNTDFGTNSRYGTILENSTDINLNKNTYHGKSTYDISIRSSNNCSLTQNKMTYSGLSISLRDNPSYQLLIDSSNSINDRPIYYYENKSNMNINFNRQIGQLFLNNCSENTFSNAYIKSTKSNVIISNSKLNHFNNITSTDSAGIGINMYYSPNNTFSSCSVSKNAEGFKISYSNFTTIIGNELINNSKGINYEYSNNLILRDNLIYNRISDDTEYGVNIYQGNYNTFESNRFYSHYIQDSFACKIKCSSNNSFINNSFYSKNPLHNDHAVYDNTYENNNFINSSISISLLTNEFTSSNTLNGKKIYCYSGKDGFQVKNINNISLLVYYDCSNFDVSIISFSKIAYCPVILKYCENFTISDLNISTTGIGIELDGNNNGTISDCTINSTCNAFDLSYCDNLTIYENEINYYESGLNIEHSDDIIVFNNDIIQIPSSTSASYSFADAIEGSYSYRLNITNNIIDCYSEGIDLHTCYMPIINDNQIVMSKYGIGLFNSYNYTIRGNNITYTSSCISISIDGVQITNNTLNEMNTCNYYYFNDLNIPENNYIDNFGLNVAILLLIMVLSIAITGSIFLKIKKDENRKLIGPKGLNVPMDPTELEGFKTATDQNEATEHNETKELKE